MTSIEHTTAGLFSGLSVEVVRGDDFVTDCERFHAFGFNRSDAILVLQHAFDP